MSVYYETLAAKAQELFDGEIPRATAPGLLFSEAATCLKGNIDLDFNQVMQAAEEQGKDPSNLSSLAVKVTTRQEVGQKIYGRYVPLPHATDGQIYYPTIDLVLADTTSPNERLLNRAFRHEFTHCMQENLKPPMYYNKTAQAAVRLAGMGLAASAILSGVKDLDADRLDWGLLLIDSAATYTGLGAFRKPMAWLHMLSSKEQEARIFEYQGKLAPISVTS